MNTLPYICFAMTCFSVLVSSSSAKQYGVFFQNNFGDDTELRVSFDDAVPYQDQPQMNNKTFATRVLKPGKDTVFVFGEAVESSTMKRFLFKSTVKWTTVTGKVIIQTFAAFDNHPDSRIYEVKNQDTEDYLLIIWSLRSNGRYTVNGDKEIPQKDWSTVTGRLWKVSFENKRQDEKDIEILSIEDRERWLDLPSITRSTLKFRRNKKLEFTEDDRDIHYECTVKWEGVDHSDIVKTFDVFTSAQAQYYSKFTMPVIYGIQIVYELKKNE